MNARFSHFLQAIALAILLTAAHSASAFYDPSIGRWVSRDPIGEKGDANLYGFVRNNPISRIDYIGLCCCVKNGPRAHWVRQNNSQRPSETFQLTFQTFPDGSASPGGNGCCKFSDCGFRQLVEGHEMVNGQQLHFNSGAHLPITENSFVDDGISMADNEDENPSFLFQDSPGGGGPYEPSWDLDVWMSFTAQIFDTSANNKIVAEKKGYWIRIAGTYDPQYRMTHGGFDD